MEKRLFLFPLIAKLVIKFQLLRY